MYKSETIIDVSIFNKYIYFFLIDQKLVITLSLNFGTGKLNKRKRIMVIPRIILKSNLIYKQKLMGSLFTGININLGQKGMIN